MVGQFLPGQLVQSQDACKQSTFHHETKMFYVVISDELLHQSFLLALGFNKETQSMLIFDANVKLVRQIFSYKRALRSCFNKSEKSWLAHCSTKATSVSF